MPSPDPIRPYAAVRAKLDALRRSCRRKEADRREWAIFALALGLIILFDLAGCLLTRR